MRKPKYELTDNIITMEDGTVLHQIRALKRFNGVRKGDLGGYVEGYKNLNQDGNCWVTDNAMVYQNAWVADDARISGLAVVKGHAVVRNNASVYGGAFVKDYAKVGGHACVGDNSVVYKFGEVFGAVWVSSNAKVSAPIVQNAIIQIEDDADISDSRDVAYVSGFGSVCRGTTFYRTSDGRVRVCCGCFRGTLDEFRKKVKERHGENSTLGKEYLAVADLMELRFSN